jgi:GR25 family glycosyltransferase involved in LPS biosynthesis
MFDRKIALILFVALFVIVLVLCILQMTQVQSSNKKPDTFIDKTKSFVINLDKNIERLTSFMESYTSSDLNVIPIERFVAINGKQIDISQYVSDTAYKQILHAESNGYRMRHYELTRGAVGCFLSHASLFNRLLKDPKHSYYLIFEDDAKVPPKCLDSIKIYIENAPEDWDILLFGVLRKVITARNSVLDKVRVWWGLFGYAINKRGAKKVIDYLNQNNKIDKQVDSMLSLMIIEGKLNVYSTREQIINHNPNNTATDIQLPVKVAKDVDPFKYENITL